MAADVSLFPLVGIMLICRGCGGERHVPDDVVAALASVGDLDAFLKSPGGLGRYHCRCGKGKTCDVRITPNKAAQDALREKEKE